MDPNAPYTPLYHPCAQCGDEPQMPGDELGSRCRTAAMREARLRHQDPRMAEAHRAGMPSVPAPRIPAPAAAGRPTVPCPSCGASIGVDRGDRWGCVSCGRSPHACNCCSSV
jgi:hypothetical protein